MITQEATEFTLPKVREIASPGRALGREIHKHLDLGVYVVFLLSLFEEFVPSFIQSPASA